jgi:SAM-dependent methyltransferase
MSSADARRNRAAWDAASDEYQARHREFIGQPESRWGMWQLPESELQVLGDVAGKDVLEYGCGAAQWSILLARAGARPVALDNSGRQLEHARALMAEAGVDFRLVLASAEEAPFDGESFDIVFCDHGAMTFADPYATVPQVARVLRPGGLFAFSHTTALSIVCYDAEADTTVRELRRDLFGLHRIEWPDQSEPVEFNLPQGKWIELFRANGFLIEDLIEVRPPEGASSTYRSPEETEWARRWPMEQIWKLRKDPDSTRAAGWDILDVGRWVADFLPTRTRDD